MLDLIEESDDLAEVETLSGALTEKVNEVPCLSRVEAEAVCDLTALRESLRLLRASMVRLVRADERRLSDLDRAKSRAVPAVYQAALRLFGDKEFGEN